MNIQIHIGTSFSNIPCKIQDEISLPGQNPFFNGHFLQVLEQSGCLSEAAGWEIQYVWLSDQDQPIFFMPMYFKHHSWGEYVFDHAWADAYQRHGLRYYPKWVSCIPFTPSVGPRWWVKEGADEQACFKVVCEAMVACLKNGVGSSWHILFSDQILPDYSEFIQRKDTQFHWFNRGYVDFDDFLSSLKSRKRKNIARERASLREQGVLFQRKVGTVLTGHDWQHFYQCYCQTYFERGMKPYLSQSFFQQIGEAMPDQIMMVLASVEGKSIAAALCFFDSTTLYGRYWGTLRSVAFLHFEVCFYQGIEFCLERGLTRFDPGTQGEHKLLRGFEPVETCSLHMIGHAGFKEAIRAHVEQEKNQIERYHHNSKDYLPFKLS